LFPEGVNALSSGFGEFRYEGVQLLQVGGEVDKIGFRSARQFRDGADDSGNGGRNVRSRWAGRMRRKAAAGSPEIHLPWTGHREGFGMGLHLGVRAAGVFSPQNIRRREPCDSGTAGCEPERRARERGLILQDLAHPSWGQPIASPHRE